MVMIRQAGHNLVKLASQTESIARRFKQNTERLFQDLKNNLGDSTQTHKIWYGPRASKCLTTATRREEKFREMGRNLDNLATTIQTQAEAWGAQQYR